MLLSCDPPFFYCKKDSDFGNVKCGGNVYHRLIGPYSFTVSTIKTLTKPSGGLQSWCRVLEAPCYTGVPCSAVALWEDLRDPMIES